MEQNYPILTGAERLNEVPMSGIRVIMNQARALAKEGHKVVGFGAGEPNFNTPEPIKQAAIRALEDNYTHYGANWGQPELREAISRKLLEDTGVCYQPETELLVTCGGAEGIQDVIMSTVNPGDEVLLFKPAFVNYEAVLKMAGAVILNMHLQPEQKFQIDLEAVEKKISSKTKMIIINSPNNPTGVVYQKELLQGLAQLAVKYNLLVLSDEIYNNLTYEDAEFVSMASFPGMKERTIIVNGFSKTYAMTGWRLGYVAAPAELMPVIVKNHQYVSTSLPTFLQIGMANAMNLPETKEAVSHMKQEFALHREMLLAGLDTIPQLSYVKPYGAFYCMIDVSRTGLDGETFAHRLLYEKYVATVPAVCFDEQCGQFIRVSFAASTEDITEGIRRIKEFVQEL